MIIIAQCLCVCMCPNLSCWHLHNAATNEMYIDVILSGKLQFIVISVIKVKAYYLIIIIAKRYNI